MRIDFKRLLIFLLICFIGQYVISYAVSGVFLLMHWTSLRAQIVMLVVIDILIGFLFAFLYYPREYRRGIFSNPSFYRDAGIFALIFLFIDALRILL